VNTYSDQQIDISVFRTGFPTWSHDNTHGSLCDLSGDHVSGDLDTIASSSRVGCGGIASGSRICGVCDVDSDGGINSGVCAFDGGRISGVCIVSGVASGTMAATALPAAVVVVAMASSMAAGGCDGIASGCPVCDVYNVHLDRGIASSVRAFDGGCVKNGSTASNAAINVDVTALFMSLDDEGFHGSAVFVLL
jgi:hypothetical protein